MSSISEDIDDVFGEEPEEVLSELSFSDGDDELSEDDLDNDDRERLANMTELEREMEVALKEERLQQKRQRAQLLRTEKKRKKESKDIADGKKTATEKRSQDAKRAALEDLVARKRRQIGKNGKKSSTKKTLEDGEGEDEEEFDEYEEEDEYEQGEDLYAAEADVEVDTDPEPASYLEAKTIQMRRHKMEEWFDKPFFKNVMNGVVVRLAVGSKKSLPGEMEERNRTSYVCAKVVGLAEREPGYYKYHSSQPWKSPYPFGKGKTSLWLRVVRGGSEKFWPLAQVSNSSISEQEWFHYQQGESKSDGGRELTRGDVERAKKRLLEAENYTYSEKDVSEMLRSKKAVIRNAALEKARLERERDAAVQRGEGALAAELNEDIQKLERASARRKKEDKMAKVNAKNAKKNFQDGLAFKEDVTGGDKGGDEMDPFRRRATRPMVYWKTKMSEEGADLEDISLANAGLGTSVVDEVVDVHDTIRQLLTYVSEKKENEKFHGGLYNPNSNTRRRMMSRKFNNDGRDNRIRVYYSVEEYDKTRY